MTEYDGSRFALQYRPTNPEAVNQSVREGLMMPLTAYEHRKRGDEEDALAHERLSREVHRDERNANREDQSLALRRDEGMRSDRRSGQREDLYRTQENRRESQAMFERNHLLDQEHAALVAQLHNARSPEDAEEIAQRLEYLGYHIRRPDAQPAPVLSPAPVAPTAPALPMSKGDAATSAALDVADQTYSKGLGVKAGLGAKGLGYHQALDQANAQGLLGVQQVGKDRWEPIPKAQSDRDSAANGSPQDAGLSRQLDAADQKYSRGLGVAPGGLGGAAPAARRQSLDVPLSGAMLSPDDPYNRLVK